MSVYYFDRESGGKRKELVAGAKYLQWLYATKTGSFLLHFLIKRKLFSSFYGRLQDTSLSRHKIKRFVTELEIDMREAEREDINMYRTFNDFFTRKLKPEARPINKDPRVLISPADGRLLAWENIQSDKLLQVKGMTYTLADLLQDKRLADSYEQGACVVIRLNPADYHRFHFPDSGIPAQSVKIKGKYYSVNPLALKRIPRLYCENKRELTVFNSDNFGQMLLMEIGATCVGSIVQTYTPGKYTLKGSEKGYFKFGGSTIILFLPKNAVKIDADLLQNTAAGSETKIKMGEQIGLKS
ncbi:MAG TPA: phosphatidylserine decarboxylase [Peptococcaceae bacterium]|nr:phosphatidylserine decarboxylase [Peptococcaceae bacterium]